VLKERVTKILTTDKYPGTILSHSSYNNEDFLSINNLIFMTISNILNIVK
jgi:hypothetical protein